MCVGRDLESVCCLLESGNTRVLPGPEWPGAAITSRCLFIVLGVHRRYLHSVYTGATYTRTHAPLGTHGPAGGYRVPGTNRLPQLYNWRVHPTDLALGKSYP
jgi:hypothetical protein